VSFRNKCAAKGLETKIKKRKANNSYCDVKKCTSPFHTGISSKISQSLKIYSIHPQNVDSGHYTWTGVLKLVNHCYHCNLGEPVVWKCPVVNCRDNPHISFISYNLDWLDLWLTQCWLVTRGWLGLAVGSCNASKPRQIHTHFVKKWQTAHRHKKVDELIYVTELIWDSYWGNIDQVIFWQVYALSHKP